MAGLLELKELGVIKGYSLAFTNPVSAVLLFNEVLGLHSPLRSGYIGLLQFQLFLHLKIGLLLFQIVKLSQLSDSALE